MSETPSDSFLRKKRKKTKTQTILTSFTVLGLGINIQA